MSLDQSFLDELKSRVSIAQIAGRKVTWDQKKSNRGRGDWWAPCPFHHEKTASFHVLDRDGRFYCFGCQEKGSVIDFVMKTENLGFIEAVESLAAEAGMEMPARDPGEKARTDRKAQLAEVMEQAARHFRLGLAGSAGAAAREYLAGRGLTEEVAARWEIGYAPPGWQGLRDRLTAAGVPDQALIDCGLTRASDKGKAPYDVFRDRIIFPIRDARGRCIAFGGRAMDPDENAKYLNSPETELFDKGRNLYNIRAARGAAGKGAPVILAEGYMDVIALSEAGFPGAVAPLGTAVTPEQLALLWRVADEPVVALDGDKAGLKAAMRLLDLALPMLEAGRTLLFALMPAGMDPDDLIRAEGPAAVARRIEAAEPLVEMLWRRETEDAVLDSPERRAAFDQRLRDALGRIRDEQVRYHYSEAIKERRAALFRPAGFAEARALPFRGRIGKGVPAGPTPGLKESRLAQGDAAAADEARIAVILAALLRHPGLIIEFEDALDRLDPRGEALRAVREALLRHAAEGEGDPASAISRDHLEKLFRTGHVRHAPVVASEDPDHVRLVVGDALRMLAARRGAEAEIEDAVRVLGGAETGGGDEGVTWRLGQAAEALSGRAGGADEDRREYDTGPNGARMAKDERDAFRRLLGGIVYGEDRGRKR